MGGCALVAAAFATVSAFAGLLSSGILLVGLAVLYDRGGGDE